MGVALAQLRMMYLTLRRNDLEYKVQLVTQTQMGLSRSLDGLINLETDLDPDSPELKVLQQRKQRLQGVEKKLEMQMQRYQSQLKMVETEFQSAQKMLDKNIQRSFTYGGGR